MAGNFRVYKPGEKPGLPSLVAAGIIIVLFAVAGGWYFLKKREPAGK